MFGKNYLSRDLLQGKVIAIDGLAKVSNKELVDKRKINGMYDF